MGELANWYCKRLAVLARGPRSYGVFDTVNAALAKRQLIAPTPRRVGSHRREYEITEAGRAALQKTADGGAARTASPLDGQSACLLVPDRICA